MAHPSFATDEKIFTYGKLMFWLMIACLFEEIGMPRCEAHRLIRRNQSFVFFKTVYLDEREVPLVTVKRDQHEGGE